MRYARTLLTLTVLSTLASPPLPAIEPAVVHLSRERPLVRAKYVPLRLETLGAAFADPVAAEAVISLTTDALNLAADRVLADVLKSPDTLPPGASIVAVANDPSKVFAFITRGRGTDLSIVPGPLTVAPRPGAPLVQAFLVTLPSGRVYYVFSDDGSIAFPFGQGGPAAAAK